MAENIRENIADVLAENRVPESAVKGFEQLPEPVVVQRSDGSQGAAYLADGQGGIYYLFHDPSNDDGYFLMQAEEHRALHDQVKEEVDAAEPHADDRYVFDADGMAKRDDEGKLVFSEVGQAHANREWDLIGYEQHFHSRIAIGSITPQDLQNFDVRSHDILAEEVSVEAQVDNVVVPDYGGASANTVDVGARIDEPALPVVSKEPEKETFLGFVERIKGADYASADVPEDLKAQYVSMSSKIERQFNMLEKFNKRPELFENDIVRAQDKIMSMFEQADDGLKGALAERIAAMADGLEAKQGVVVPKAELNGEGGGPILQVVIPETSSVPKGELSHNYNQVAYKAMDDAFESNFERFEEKPFSSEISKHDYMQRVGALCSMIAAVETNFAGVVNNYHVNGSCHLADAKIDASKLPSELSPEVRNNITGKLEALQGYINEINNPANQPSWLEHK